MSGSINLSTDPFTDAEKADIRRFCGYPAYRRRSQRVSGLALLPGVWIARVSAEQSGTGRISGRAALSGHALPIGDRRPWRRRQSGHRQGVGLDAQPG